MNQLVWFCIVKTETYGAGYEMHRIIYAEKATLLDLDRLYNRHPIDWNDHSMARCRFMVFAREPEETPVKEASARDVVTANY